MKAGGRLPALFPTVEGVGAQLLGATLVIGSYFVAEHVRITRPRARAALRSA